MLRRTVETKHSRLLIADSRTAIAHAAEFWSWEHNIHAAGYAAAEQCGTK